MISLVGRIRQFALHGGGLAGLVWSVLAGHAAAASPAAGAVAHDVTPDSGLSARSTAVMGFSNRYRLPVWELGVAVSGISLPDYRGADRQRRYLVPFPVFVYRAPHLRVDRSGIRADLWAGAHYELDVSVGLTPPLPRTTAGVRAGMPRLQPLFEVGPRLKIPLWHAAHQRRMMSLDLPVRHAMPLGKWQHRGWVFSPSLNWQADDLPGLSGWQFSAWGGPVFATRAYHRYYYQVDPAYAREGRPVFPASGGYGGLVLGASLNRRFSRTWVAGFVRASQIGGAAFSASPLVRRHANLSAGIALGWLFARSADEVRQQD